MKKRDIFFQVLLGLFINPFLKEDEVKSMWVIVFFCLQPNHEKWKMVFNLFSIENPIHHMTTEQPHFYFVSCMTIKLFIFMNQFENVWSGWSIGELEVVKRFLCNREFVSFIKILDRDLIQDGGGFVVSIFKKNLSFHDFFIELVDFLFVLNSFCALRKLVFTESSFCQSFWHFTVI